VYKRGCKIGNDTCGLCVLIIYLEDFMKRIGLALVILIMTVAMAFGGGGSQPTLASTNVVTVEVFDRGSDARA